MRDDFALFSQFLWNLKFEIWNLKFIFLGSHKNLFLELFHKTYLIYSPWQVWKRMKYGLKYSVTGFLSNEK